MDAKKVNKLPSSLGAERYLTTCCLNDPDVVLEIASKLTPDDFYHQLYRHVYQACLNIVEHDLVPDPMSVYNRLEKVALATPDQLKEIELLARAAWDKKNVNEYVEELRACSARRQLIAASEKNIDEMYRESALTPETALGYCEENILAVGNKLTRTESVAKIGEGILGEIMSRADNPTDVPGIPMGFGKLDQTLGGLQGGRLYVLAARFKTGKSIWLMNIAANTALGLGIPVLMIDTENPTDQINDRFISLLSGVEEQKIKNGTFVYEPNGKERVEEAIHRLENGNIYHLYMPNFNFDACYAVIKRFKVQKHIGLLIFDYIKVPDNTEFRNVQEHQMLGYLTSNLHNKIAGAMDIPVVTACQMGRRAIGAPEDSDDMVADSDRIGRYADVVMYLREKTEDEKMKYGADRRSGNMVLTVQTHRGGPAREYAHDIFFDRPVMKMSEVRARKL